MPHTPTWMSIPVCFALAALVCGCATRGDVELLEARLRSREDQLAGLRAELVGVRTDLDVARSDADQLRSQLAGTGTDALLPEQADALYRAKGIRVLGLLTAGVNENDEPGDEGFTTVVAPYDADGALVKLPGRLEIEVREPADDGSETTIGRWEFDPGESRELWQHDLLGGGFRVRRPWQRTPTSERVTLAATLHTPDGRRFETSSAIAVVPPPQPIRPVGVKIESAALRVPPRPLPPLPPLDESRVPSPFDVEPSPETDRDEIDVVEPNPFESVEDAVTEPAFGEELRGEFAPHTLDRDRPTRTSDRFELDEIPRYN